MFAGLNATAPVDRRDYGEPRFIIGGFLRDRMVVMVWTPRGDAIRVISMRYSHAEEEARWRNTLGGPG